ncbi:CidA/LrgA family protein [Actibacterium sp. MT2.3-13A]|uniref:CidA/LrgA family protein n=1 Tax=Actibacterium sp. MT2.3-13A TaxID=2828332 RepID=UPI001BA54726|nr:CidA/LrgA family protein [Actibacterium sp. MT2.3-13A]
MILNLALLLLFQLAGEVTARALSLPVPGPVIGLAALVLAFLAVPGLAGRMQPTAGGLLAHLSLLFVPAGVGVVGHLGVLGAQGGPLLLALIGSTVLAIAVGAGVFVGVQRLTGGAE